MYSYKKLCNNIILIKMLKIQYLQHNINIMRLNLFVRTDRFFDFFDIENIIWKVIVIYLKRFNLDYFS
jgi:hypothetical protein